MSFVITSPANAATLLYMGYVANVDFLASDVGDGSTHVEWLGQSEPAQELVQTSALPAAKAARIAAINAECRARLVARFGDALEQNSRAVGAYGAAEQAALKPGIETMIDASNTASNAVLAAADIAEVEAVSVSWPAI